MTLHRGTESRLAGGRPLIATSVMRGGRNVAPAITGGHGVWTCYPPELILAAMRTRSRTMLMTIGELSRRTGMPVKALRDYEGMGLISTVGRSPGNYRLFDGSALWCVGVIRGLRSLALTVAEICEVVGIYLGQTRPAKLAACPPYPDPPLGNQALEHRPQHARFLRAGPGAAVRATPLLPQRPDARLPRGLHVAGGAAWLRRMQGAGRLQLDSPQGRPGRLPGARARRPRGAASQIGTTLRTKQPSATLWPRLAEQDARSPVRNGRRALLSTLGAAGASPDVS